MLVYCESIKKYERNSTFFVFADVHFQYQNQLRYALVRISDESKQTLEKFKGFKPGQLFPTLTIGAKIPETEFYRVIPHNAYGVIKFNSPSESNEFFVKFKKGDILFDYSRFYKSQIIFSITKKNISNNFYFDVSKTPPGTEDEYLRLSHMFESEVYVYSESIIQGYNYWQIKNNRELQIDNVFYELGKEQFRKKNFKGAIRLLKNTLYFFENDKKRSNIIGYTLMYIARCYVELNEIDLANQYYLDKRCALNSSRDYFYRSIISKYFNHREDFTIEELIKLKSDSEKFRNLLVKEFKVKERFQINNIFVENRYERHMFYQYVTSHFIESINNYLLVDKFIEGNIKESNIYSKNDIDINSLLIDSICTLNDMRDSGFVQECYNNFAWEIGRKSYVSDQ